MHAPSESAWLRWAPWCVALLAVFAWLPPLGLHDYWYPDEPDVALPVLEMLARGDWIVPTAGGAPWLDYPPLTYWGGLLWSQLLGGPTPFALRLAPLIAGGVFLLATVSIARQVAGRTAAWYAVLVGVATPIVWMMATTLQVDMPFAAPQAAGYALYLAGDGRRGGQAWALRIAAFACFGLAILAKGPLGLLLPGFVLVLWHGSQREWSRLLWLAPLALVSLAVAALWYAPLVHRLGVQFVGRELWLQNFDRFGTTTRGHGGKGPFYYVESLLSDLGPWVFLLPAALAYAWRNREQRGLRLIGLWFAVSFLFLTAASTKRNVYLLPAYPAICALIGAWIALQRNSRWLRASLAVTAALFLGAGVALAVWLQTPLAAQARLAPVLPWLPWPSRILAVVFGGGAVLMALALRRREEDRAVRALSATLLVAFTAAMWLLMPVIDRVHNYTEPGSWVDATEAPGEPLGFYAPGKESLKRAGWLCHIGTRRLEFLPDAAAAAAWLAAEPGRVIVADPETAAAVPGSRIVRAWRIGDQPWNALVQVRGDAAPQR
jgi:4-amino-4-deoxy-L-arabinose transferase-like glycosyltransferase